MEPAPPTPRTVFVDATRVPTVTPPPTPTPGLPSATVKPTLDSSHTVSPTPKPLSEREAYCRDHALPTATPETRETPIPVPTSPPGISDDEIPSEWFTKMDEIEAWVRDYYDVHETSVGPFKRRFVNEKVWKEWMADNVEDWADDEDTTAYLWEQTYRTLTLLFHDHEYTNFVAAYQGDRFVGAYLADKSEFIVQAAGSFDLDAELTYLHEFAHHVQNEKYDYPFFKECFKADLDALNALQAVIEGDATRTEFAYIDQVIGWDLYTAFFESIDESDGADEAEPWHDTPMTRYLDEQTEFTYSAGLWFTFMIATFSECQSCVTERQRIDEAFERPPYTTEQIYHEAKYFDGEGRDPLSLPEDVLGEGWELRSGTTIGKSDWIALLATLVNGESDDIEPEHPGWRGDYGMLFEDDEGRALYLQVVVWENKRYIESLVDAFDNLPRMSRAEIISISDETPFDYYYIWDVDTGSIAMGVELQPADRFYTMFLAVGPDIDSVEDTVYAARDNLITDE